FHSSRDWHGTTRTRNCMLARLHAAMRHADLQRARHAVSRLHCHSRRTGRNSPLAGSCVARGADAAFRQGLVHRLAWPGLQREMKHESNWQRLRVQIRQNRNASRNAAAVNNKSPVKRHYSKLLFAALALTPVALLAQSLAPTPPSSGQAELS